ncbi:DUF2958 domain-containing protein [Stappia sp. ICDLI1TA098]
MKLLTKAQFDQLMENGRRQEPMRGTPQEIDFLPVVKLFNPCGAGTWLLTEIDPENPDIAFGLCDLGYPELGSVSLEELQSVSLPFGLSIERDRHWTASKPLSAYAVEARAAGRIVA